MFKLVFKIISGVALTLLLSCGNQENGQIMTVNGLISSDSAGKFLTHEHLLVDFMVRWITNSFPGMLSVKVLNN